MDVRLARKGEHTLEGRYIEFVDMLIYYVFNFFKQEIVCIFVQIYIKPYQYLLRTLACFGSKKSLSDPNCLSAQGKGTRTGRQYGGMHIVGVAREEQAHGLDHIPNHVV